MDTDNNNKGMVEEYTGSAWTTVGAADFTPGGAYGISGAFYNNNLYVSYADSTEGNLVTVEEYTSGSWMTIGNPGFGSSASYTSMALDGNGTPYVAFLGSTGNASYLMEYTGTNWITVGGGQFSTGGAGTFPSLAFDSSNNPYVAFGDVLHGGASVVEYVSGAWDYLGGFSGAGGSTSHVANYTSLVFNGATPYVAYMDLGNSAADNVMEWNGASWIPVGSTGVTPTNAYFSTLAVSPTNNNLYLSFSDESNPTSEAMVMEHTGSGWVTVGGGHFSAYSTSYNSLAFDTSGDPYVAYADGNTGTNKVTVMEYH
jgi:hypothetical protein